MKIIFHNNIVNNDNFYNLCEKYFDKLVILFNEEVFETRRGAITLHFDKDGKIRLVDKTTRKEMIFK